MTLWETLKVQAVEHTMRAIHKDMYESGDHNKGKVCMVPQWININYNG